MAQAILLTGRERRRRWSSGDRVEILDAAFAPGANVSEVARRFDVSTGLIYSKRSADSVWRKVPRHQGLNILNGPSIGHAN